MLKKKLKCIKYLLIYMVANSYVNCNNCSYKPGRPIKCDGCDLTLPSNTELRSNSYGGGLFKKFKKTKTNKRNKRRYNRRTRRYRH